MVDPARWRLGRIFASLQTIDMPHDHSIHELQPGLTPFPDDVFARNQPWLADYILPLISIDLGLLKSSLAGTVVHMVCPIEPYDSNIGERTEFFHNEFTSSNWLAFELTLENRLRFLGNEAYFQNAPQHDGSFDSKGFQAHAIEMKESYFKAREYFKKNARLASYSRYGNGQAKERNYLDRLGGKLRYGNWTGHPPLPPAFLLEDLAGSQMKRGFVIRNNSDHLPDDGIRISHKGKPFLPVAEVAAYNWCATGADAILMFYEPESRTVLFTFDWS